VAARIPRSSTTVKHPAGLGPELRVCGTPPRSDPGTERGGCRASGQAVSPDLCPEYSIEWLTSMGPAG
jgi:hypothetical protein